MSAAAIARRQIEFARGYTLSLLEGLQPEDWYPMPGGVSNIAWQVGHLAMAQYALTMIRIRGKEPHDSQFISNAFFKRFKKGSQPDADPQQNPTPEELLATLDAVHQRALSEIAAYTDEQLQEKLPEPHAVFDTKLGSLFFCGAHEMLHAGQIGLLRRQLGKPTLR
jgi:hypothetical protein